jgi:hypothetical protein
VQRGRGPGVERDLGAEALGVVAGVLERGPDRLEEDALLGVHPAGFAGGDAEEVVVEEVGALEHPAGPHEVGVRPQRLGRERRRLELVFGEERDRLDPGAQVLPEGLEIARARQAG